MLVREAQELPQRIGPRDAEVVARQKTNPHAATQRVSEIVEQQSYPRGLDERRDDVGSVGLPKRLAKALDEVVVLPVDEARQGGERLRGWRAPAVWVVLLLRRDDPSHASARVVHVAPVPGDDVDVEMHDSLPCGLAHVESHVEAVGLELLIELELHLRHELENPLLLLGRGLEPGGDEPPGDHERVARGHRESVPERECELVRRDPLRGLAFEEGGPALHPWTFTRRGREENSARPPCEPPGGLPPAGQPRRSRGFDPRGEHFGLVRSPASVRLKAIASFRAASGRVWRGPRWRGCGCLNGEWQRRSGLGWPEPDRHVVRSRER